MRDDPEQHRITLTSVQKWTQDFFDNFPKVNDPTILEFMATFFCLDKTTWSPSFKVRIRCRTKVYKCEEKKITEFFYIWRWAGAKDSEGVQGIGTRMGLDRAWICHSGWIVIMIIHAWSMWKIIVIKLSLILMSYYSHSHSHSHSHTRPNPAIGRIHWMMWIHYSIYIYSNVFC